MRGTRRQRREPIRPRQPQRGHDNTERVHANSITQLTTTVAADSSSRTTGERAAGRLRAEGSCGSTSAKLEGIRKFQCSKARPAVLFQAAHEDGGGQTCVNCSIDIYDGRESRDSEAEMVTRHRFIQNSAETGSGQSMAECYAFRQSQEDKNTASCV